LAITWQPGLLLFPFGKVGMWLLSVLSGPAAADALRLARISAQTTSHQWTTSESSQSGESFPPISVVARLLASENIRNRLTAPPQKLRHPHNVRHGGNARLPHCAAFPRSSPDSARKAARISLKQWPTMASFEHVQLESFNFSCSQLMNKRELNEFDRNGELLAD
jgi:hypothetical protein